MINIYIFTDSRRLSTSCLFHTMSQWPSPGSHAQAYANPRSNESGDTGFGSNPGSNNPTQDRFSPMSNTSGDSSSVGDYAMWNQVTVPGNAVSNSFPAVSSAVAYISTGHSDPASYENFGANIPVAHAVTGQSNPASMSWSPDTAVSYTTNTETSNPASYGNFNLETLNDLMATIRDEEFASAPEGTDTLMHLEMPINVTPNFLGSQVGSNSQMTVVSASPMQPYLKILRQPQRNGHRFRYTSERGSHGTLEADRMSGDQKKKEYVSVKLVGYRPRAKIVASLVTNDSQRESHIHRLVPKKFDLSANEWSHPEIQVNMACDMTATFNDIAVAVFPQKMLTDMHIKEHICAEKRKSRSVSINPAVRRKLDEELKSKIKRLKKFDGQHIVVLKFEAYSLNEDGLTGPQLCSPVFSSEVINQRSTQNGELRIYKIGKSAESCQGGQSRENDTEMLMFTSKVKKGGKKCIGLPVNVCYL
ncbi:PREDICTED: nuclear factor NF-kappa-B p105 subunit-like isoform X2 [Priapulus caudatus]|uniref:Nuclear factor NF-kappa-B p105 subunit-like isoform X2 n=1 Tax=Priapulus caudatus TaxID=37621 RepID=A0ABM1ETG4_PRICU|nr:PREDICTED: nuclear factor NF-kappa-B p105 subunit-like isoform X2 [Priapulus caudatus]